MKFHKLMATMALLFVAFDSRASLIHKYELNGSLADSLGGPALVKHGQGTVGATEYKFGANQGLRLDKKLGGVYTIDMEFRFDHLNNFSHWNRILAANGITGSSGEFGLYTHYTKFNFYNYGLETGNVQEKDTIRMTVTRDANKLFNIYQDGALVMSLTDNKNYGDFNTNSAYFFVDNGGEAAAGAVNFIRIHDNALSSTEVAGLMAAELPEPGSFGLLAAGLALVGWTRRRKA